MCCCQRLQPAKATDAQAAFQPRPRGREQGQDSLSSSCTSNMDVATAMADSRHAEVPQSGRGDLHPRLQSCTDANDSNRVDLNVHRVEFRVIAAVV